MQTSCVIAIVLGKKLGTLLGDRAEVVGGIVLVGIGLKAFFGI
ncbi:manganese efflux pump [uncultured Olegusella sp.]|nr:manganese efflux pump [uncultured Olegusella sp.]